MKDREDCVCALLLGEFGDDRLLLQQVFRDLGWILLEARGRKEALMRLNQESVHVVITRSECPGGGWKKVLYSLRRYRQPPQLIVTSRSPDEQLWSEVLSYGGYDLLAEPFRRDEVERVVAAARRHYGPQQVYAMGAGMPHPSVAGWQPAS
jgi:DNA-binding response OmpR family regulator